MKSGLTKLRLRGKKLVIMLVCVAVVVVAAGVVTAVELTRGGSGDDEIPVVGGLGGDANPPQSDTGGLYAVNQEVATVTTDLWPTTQSPQVSISGPAVINRPEGKTVATAEWGTESGQFGLAPDDEGDGAAAAPLEVAVSPDGETIGILDAVNGQVALFSRDGRLQERIPMPSGEFLADLALGPHGWVYVLAYGGTLYRVAPSGDRSPQPSVAAPGIEPEYLLVDGSSVWAVGMGDVVYRVIDDGSPLAVEEQQASAVIGAPVGDKTFHVGWRSSSRVFCVVRDAKTKKALDVEIVSEDLPLNDLWGLGADSDGNYYFMARVWADGWSGTESWQFIGIAADGTLVGHLRLPLDFYAGGSWTVTPDGRILEVRSTETGVEMIEHRMEVQQ